MLNRTACLQFCSFYKPGVKEDIACGGYETLNRFAARGRDLSAHPADPSCNADATESLILRVCGHCGFREDGCDFIVDRISTPCGGFVLLSRLVAARKISIEEL